MNILLRYTIAFVIGILLYTYSPVIEVKWIVISIVAISTFTGWQLYRYTTHTRYTLGISLFLLFILLGWLRTSQQPTAPNLADVVAYKVVVNSLPEVRAKTYRVEGKLLAVKEQDSWKPTKAKILLYIAKDATIPRYGDLMLIRATPQVVKSPLNPDQFNYKRYLALQGIFHQQYIRQTDFMIVAHKQGSTVKSWAYAMSEWSDNALKKLVPYLREYAVAKAMLLGTRDEMDNDLVEAYAAAGAVHVLSVSGFHITVFMAILTFFLGFLAKRKKGKWLYVGITLGVLWFYAMLTGLSAPVVRSALMFSIFLLAKPLNKKQNTLNSLFASALILLAIEPLQLFSVSFQLSYLALSGILVLQPPLYQLFSIQDWLTDKLWGMTTVAIAAQIATFPIAAYYFHQFPTYFLLANPIVMILGAAMLPVGVATILLSWIPLLSHGLGWLLTVITWILNESIILTEKLPVAILSNLSISLLELTLIYLILFSILMLLYKRDIRWGRAIIVFTLVLLVWQVYETHQLKNQKEIVIHAVPNQTVISLVSGNKVMLMADSIFFQPTNKPFNFYLKDFYIAHQLSHRTSISLEDSSNTIRILPFGKLLIWQGYRILLIEKPIKASLPPIDLIVIGKGACRKIEDIKNTFGNSKVIFDSSTKSYLLNQLWQEVERQQLPYHFVHEQGAWRITLTNN